MKTPPPNKYHVAVKTNHVPNPLLPSWKGRKRRKQWGETLTFIKTWSRCSRQHKSGCDFCPMR